jgi:PII-like signaling protein
MTPGRLIGKQKLMRIFIGEDDTYNGKPLFKVIVNYCKENGIAGATVIRGIYGYGASSTIHSSRTLALSQDLPIIIEIIDTMENIEKILPDIETMIKDTHGIITLELAEIIKYF